MTSLLIAEGIGGIVGAAIIAATLVLAYLLMLVLGIALWRQRKK